MEIHGYNQDGSIDVTIDDVRWTVPNDPANRHHQLIAEWVAEGNTIPPYVAPPSSAVQVKAECQRRILAVMPEYAQRNTLAAGQAAVMQYGADPADWPPELQARQQAAMQAWAEIERLRARSNEIEAMDPIPADLTDDALWAAQ